uniref:Uncharacterized protein n=1 Tax=Kalanchoe fedtschenkoi TaxID=63787 RepID=A0A7N0V292_KALFE
MIPAAGENGGKAKRWRPIAASRTPYDRPSGDGSVGGSNNWLSQATRKIADGAGRVMRSVLWLDSSSSSSADGTESSCSDGEDEANTDACCSGPSSQDGKPKNGRADGDIGGANLDYVLMGWGSETKRAIVMLLMQETFSKEESECMIDIIKSRNADDPHSENRPVAAPDAHSTDICCNAVMEARKWMNERKLRSLTKSASPSGPTFCSYSYSSSPSVTGQYGSPIEIARSYMRSHSPSHMKTVAAYMTPQPERMLSLCEGSPCPNRGKSLFISEDISPVGSCDAAEDAQLKVLERSQEINAHGGAKRIILARPWPWNWTPRRSPNHVNKNP